MVYCVTPVAAKPLNGSAKRINEALVLANVSKRRLARDLTFQLKVDFDTAHAYVKRWTNRGVTPKAGHLDAVAQVLADASGQRVSVFKAALEPDPDEEEASLRRAVEDWQRMGETLMSRLAVTKAKASA